MHFWKKSMNSYVSPTLVIGRDYVARKNMLNGVLLIYRNVTS